jgi:hypothetical protein
VRLYLFEHCSLCFRVRMIAALKRLHLQETVVLEDDSDTMIGLVERRVVPIALFDASPSVVKPDYAKWMLEDPRVNFAISTRGRGVGLDHLGIQAESKAELDEVYARLRKAGGTVIEQGDTVCCYAKSEKSWIDDPAGISRETFHTTGESTVYGDGSGERDARIAHEKSCCAPQAEASAPKAACCG